MLIYYQLKTSFSYHNLFYVSPIVTIKKIFIEDSKRKIRMDQSMTLQNINEEPGKTAREKKRNTRNTRQKTIIKMTIVYPPYQ